MSLKKDATWVISGEKGIIVIPGSVYPTEATLADLKQHDFIKVGLVRPDGWSECFWAIVDEVTSTQIKAKVNNDLVGEWGIDDGDDIIVMPKHVLLILKEEAL